MNNQRSGAQSLGGRNHGRDTYDDEDDYEQPPRTQAYGRNSRNQDPYGQPPPAGSSGARVIASFNDAKNSAPLFLALFFTPNSQGSTILIPAFREFVSQCDTSVHAAMCNAEKLPSVANYCGVTRVPETKIFVHGREADTMFGSNVSELQIKVTRWAVEAGCSYAGSDTQLQRGSDFRAVDLLEAMGAMTLHLE